MDVPESRRQTAKKILAENDDTLALASFFRNRMYKEHLIFIARGLGLSSEGKVDDLIKRIFMRCPQKTQKEREETVITKALELYCASADSCSVEDIVNYARDESGVSINASQVKISIARRIKDGIIKARLDGDKVKITSKSMNERVIIPGRDEPGIVAARCLACRDKLNNIHYTCDCSAEYCFRCARSLASSGDRCMQCDRPFGKIPSIDDDGTIIISADEIDEYSRQLDDILDLDHLVHKRSKSQLTQLRNNMQKVVSEISPEYQAPIAESLSRLFSRLGEVEQGISKQSRDAQEAVVVEIRRLKDDFWRATELVLFVEKPDELTSLVKRVIASGWTHSKKDDWAASIKKILEDWRDVQPGLWHRVGKALVSVLSKAIGETAAGLVSDGIKALFDFLSSNLAKSATVGTPA